MQEIKMKYNMDEIENVARQFLHSTKGKYGFAFYGEMGVGKTTFITAVCKSLGTKDLVSSPTFAIVNEYADSEGKPIFHFDFYRIETAGELLDIGFYEYCEQEAFCFIEWPEKAEEVIPDDFISVRMEENSDGSRQLTFMI